MNVTNVLQETKPMKSVDIRIPVQGSVMIFTDINIFDEDKQIQIQT